MHLFSENVLLAAMCDATICFALHGTVNNDRVTHPLEIAQLLELTPERFQQCSVWGGLDNVRFLERDGDMVKYTGPVYVKPIVKQHAVGVLDEATRQEFTDLLEFAFAARDNPNDPNVNQALNNLGWLVWVALDSFVGKNFITNAAEQHVENPRPKLLSPYCAKDFVEKILTTLNMCHRPVARMLRCINAVLTPAQLDVLKDHMARMMENYLYGAQYPVFMYPNGLNTQQNEWLTILPLYPTEQMSYGRLSPDQKERVRDMYWAVLYLFYGMEGPWPNLEQHLQTAEEGGWNQTLTMLTVLGRMTTDAVPLSSDDED